MSSRPPLDPSHRLAALIVTRRPLGAHFIDLFGEAGVEALPPGVRALFVEAVEAENDLCGLLRTLMSEHTNVRSAP